MASKDGLQIEKHLLQDITRTDYEEKCIFLFECVLGPPLILAYKHQLLRGRT
ncbi:hypothetical protein BDZ91DRAFT_724160 [Kalaharituber pfeilii]|nr:hypothetical protein BDZ91DRAFT_724160 [Kalaharituber pfeilii]